jgi:hypothetical protein
MHGDMDDGCGGWVARGAERQGQLELTWWASLPVDLCFGRTPTARYIHIE